MNKQLIKVARKIERLMEMQWCDPEYLKGGHSIYAVWSTDEDDTGDMLFTGTFTMEYRPEHDRLVGCDLDDVAKHLYRAGKLTADERRAVDGYYGAVVT